MTEHSPDIARSDQRQCEAYDQPGQDCVTAGPEVIRAEGLCGPCAARALSIPPACWLCSHIHTESTICRARAIDGGPCVCTKDPTNPPGETP